MKLWIDDLKDPRYVSAQFGDWPEGEWTWAKTGDAGLDVLASGWVAVLALDNDLGLASEVDGWEVAGRLLDWVLGDPEFEPPAVMRCISYNPVAVDRIQATFGDIRRVVRERTERA